MFPLQYGPKGENMNSESYDTKGESKKSYGASFALKIGLHPLLYASNNQLDRRKRKLDWSRHQVTKLNVGIRKKLFLTMLVLVVKMTSKGGVTKSFSGFLLR